MIAHKKNHRLFLAPRWRGPLVLVFLVLWTGINFVLLGPEKPAFPSLTTPIHLYSNQAGDDIKSVLKTALETAQESISIAIYSLTDREIIATLRKRAEQGVKVFIVYDPVATQDVANNLGPAVTLVGRRHRGLMHNKLIVIDNKTTYLGSANLTRDSLILHANLIIGIESVPFATKVTETIRALSARTLQKRQPTQYNIAGNDLEIAFLPDPKGALTSLLARLAEAKKSLKVAMFTFTLPSLADALIAAHKRGVDVQVVIDADSAKKTSARMFQKLRRAGVAVYTSRRIGLLHHKMAIVDDDVLVAGSANWTKAAFFNNDENICFLSSLSPEQKEKLDHLWETTRKEATPSAPLHMEES